MPLVNLILFRHLEPYHYQKVLGVYVFLSLNCSSKYLDAIKIYITLIDQRRVLVKSLAPIGATISSVSDCRRKTPTPPPRGQTEQSFSLIHNILWELIKMLLEDKKFFICVNIHPEPVNCHPILEA